jgi:UDP-N-acetylmuramoyl-tripeptide--D-alanyl-D-alanine ligase
MKHWAQKLLAFFARKILAKYKPKIIGITGSVGKTSAKEAIFLVISQNWRTRKSEKNYNNEFGLPFTVIGVDSPGKNIGRWWAVLTKAKLLWLFPHRYPQALVLEMGIDRPGDMDYLLSIAHPDIAVITSIGISHYEFFHDAETIEKEKGKLAEALQGSDTLVVNADNEIALRQKSKTSVKTLTYSVSGQSDIILSDIEESLQGKFSTSFKVHTPTRDFEATINAVGKVHLSAVASAIAVGEALKMDTDSLKKGIQLYRPAPSRLNIIAGIKHSTLIDDTYNAAPDSMAEALALLDRLPAEWKMAVVGDMLELGAKSDEAHHHVGQKIAAMKVDRLITVGPGGRIIAQAAVTSGMASDKVLSFDTSDAAKKTAQEILQPGAAVLVKGSQGLRLEKVTVEIMAEPMRAAELVCRQYGKWLER